MQLSDFDFELPIDRIAQAPLGRRDEARLLVLDRTSGARAHRRVDELPALLPEASLLVYNDTRVLPARLFAHKPSGGKVELLLVEPLAGEAGRWRCLGRASKPLRPGPLALVAAEPPSCEIVSVDKETVEVRFGAGLDAYLERAGEVPLPPYIHREAPDGRDRERYQTIFARHPGAVAAPTAGLHFTPELVAALERAGHRLAPVTLHVGLGTFAPLRAATLAAVRLHPERYEVPAATEAAIAESRRRGRPIVAIGTTVVRTLEAASDGQGGVRAGAGVTSIFLRPGHRFAVVDLLFTNFHLPRSSLLVLVAAFAGRERLLAAYAEAIQTGYRFYSYGDAMLLR